VSDDRCITCGDVAVEAEVVAVDGVTATVRHGDGEEAVAVDLVTGVRAGDRLLCHAGVALERLGPR
jgi:hydrogenase maturation factor